MQDDREQTVSEKASCPGCGSHSSELYRLITTGETSDGKTACPSCDLSVTAIVEIGTVRRRVGDEQLKLTLVQTLERASRAEAERDRLQRKLVYLRTVFEELEEL
jgi:hypothetical protein